MWGLIYVFQEGTPMPPWLQDTMVSAAEKIIRVTASRTEAAFRGLASSIKGESYTTHFSYVCLANMIHSDKSSAFHGMRPQQFEEFIRRFLPSVDQSKMDMARFNRFLSRVHPSAVSKLFELQDRHNKGQDFVSLSWWTSHTECPGHSQQESSLMHFCVPFLEANEHMHSLLSWKHL